MIRLNIFSLNYMMCVEDGRRGETKRQTDKGRNVQGDKGGRDKPDKCGSENEGVG